MNRNSDIEYRDEELGDALRRLPMQEPTEAFFVRLRGEAERQGSGTARPKRPRGWLPHRPLRLAIASAGIAVVAAFPIGVAVGATTLASSKSGQRTTTTAPVLSFLPTSGWNTIQTTIPNTPDNQEVAWAANVSIDQQDSVGGQPLNTVRGLPSDGVVVWAAALPAVSDEADYSEAALPVQLAQGRLLSGQYENKPGPNIAQVGPILVHANGQYLTVIVWFGTSMPSAELRQTAQAEINNLQVP